MRTRIRCVKSSSFFQTRVDLHVFQYENDYDIGVAVIDSYTHYILEFMEGINKTSQATMEDLVRPTLSTPSLLFPTRLCSSTRTTRTKSILSPVFAPTSSNAASATLW